MPNIEMNYMFDPTEIALPHMHQLVVTAEAFTQGDIATAAQLSVEFQSADQAENGYHGLKLVGVIDGVETYAKADKQFDEIKEAFRSRYSPEDRELLIRAVAGSAISGNLYSEPPRSL